LEFGIAAQFVSIAGMATITELEGLSVKVDDVIYMPSLDAPAEKPHPFVYFISIQNNSGQRVTIQGRKWVVKEGSEVTVVEGDGVVGQTPVLEPGEDFSYNSYHVVGADAVAEGAFFGKTGSGDWVFAKIPAFELCVPDWV
jgi:ApaG protein